MTPALLSGPLKTAVSIALFLVLWALAAVLLHANTLPSPLAVARAAMTLVADGTLPWQLIVTLLRVGASFGLAMVVGSALGLGLERFKMLDWLFGPWLSVGLNLPALVILVLAYVWLGLNETAAIIAVAANKIPTVAIMMRDGARGVDRSLLEVGRAFGLSRFKIFQKIYGPQLVPAILTAARTGLALVWKIVLVAELIGRNNGIGFEIALRFQRFDIAGILALSFSFILVVALVDALIFAPVDRSLARWRA